MESIKQELQKLVKKHREEEGRRALYLTKFLRKVAKNGNGIKYISIKAFRDMATDLDETDLKFLKDNGFDVNKAEVRWEINANNWLKKIDFFDVIALNKLSNLSREYHEITTQLEKEMIELASKGKEVIVMQYKTEIFREPWVTKFSKSTLLDWLTEDPKFEGLKFAIDCSDDMGGKMVIRTYTIKTDWKEERMK